MNFKFLCINNNDFYEEKLYDIIKTKKMNGLENQMKNLITKHDTSKDMFVANVYQTLDSQHDSISFYLKTTTIYQNKDYLFQMMHVSDDDIHHGNYNTLDKYKFNFLGKLLINNDENVNGKFIIFAYKINKDNTYEFCDMTEELFYKLIIDALFKKIIFIDLDEYSELLIDNKFNVYDLNYKAQNINIDKNELIDYTENYVANFRLGIITFKHDDEEYNDILYKFTKKYHYKGDQAYIFSYYNDRELIDQFSKYTFKKLLKRDPNNEFIIPKHDIKKFIYNKFTMLES
jgi:hypothetical protein